MLRRQLVVRADASPHHGLGHLMRSLALAEEWSARGGVVTFLGYWDPPSLRRRIATAGFHSAPLPATHPDPVDAQSTLAALASSAAAGDRWLMLDGYHFDVGYQRQVLQAGHRLLLLDDNGEHLVCEPDVLLNPGPRAGELPYDCPASTRRLLGPRYVLVRRALREARRPTRRARGQGHRVLLTLGGADVANITSRVLTALAEVPAPLSVRVAVGPASPHRHTLLAEATRLQPGCELLLDPPELIPHMLWADLAISAAGVTAWELALLGVPTILLITARNQEGIAGALADEDAAVVRDGRSLSGVELAAVVAGLLADGERRTALSSRARGLLDGRGAERVVTAMVEP